jgi:hypothetical protein
LLFDQGLKPVTNIKVSGQSSLEFILVGSLFTRLIESGAGSIAGVLWAGGLSVDPEDAGKYRSGLKRRMKLSAISTDDLGRLVPVCFGCAGGTADAFEQMADAFLVGELDAEVAGPVEETGEVASHVRSKGTYDFVGGDPGFGYAESYMALDFGAVQDLVGGLVGAGGAVAGGGGGLGVIASVFDEFIDEPLPR